MPFDFKVAPKLTAFNQWVQIMTLPILIFQTRPLARSGLRPRQSTGQPMAASACFYVVSKRSARISNNGGRKWESNPPGSD